MKALARKLRRDSTDAGRLLWMHLRAGRMAGVKFRRRVVTGPYIVVFASLDAGLIIEADGGQHLEQQYEDGKRTAVPESCGYKVVRFWNNGIPGDIRSVLEQIHASLIDIPSPRSSLQGKAG